MMKALTLDGQLEALGLFKPICCAVTGGPGGGKSTALKAAEDYFGDKLLAGNEVASLLLTGGFPMPNPSGRRSKIALEFWSDRFQSAILPLQISKEELHLLEAAEKGVGLVLLDRGTMDNTAYWPWGKADFLRRFNIDQGEQYRRYDLVIHIQSTASFDPSLYERIKATNPARKETAEEAKLRDELLIEAWREHPNFNLISGVEGVESVKRQVIQILSPLIDQEIERKWIFDRLPDLALPSGTRIMQGYLIDSDQGEIRLRSYGDLYFLTLKSVGGLCRRESERQIDEELFWSFWPLCQKEVIKTRYIVPWGNHRLELDVYEKSKIPGLISLECEFKTTKASQVFQLPPWAAGAREVTGIREYNNVNQAV
jgi:CYTH domain-containing protein/predicted ATPase